MKNTNTYRPELVNAMKKLAEHGYKCYILKENPNFMYGYIVTPSDSILSVHENYYGGWEFSFNYIPSRSNGTSCQCLKNPIDTINKEIVLQAEKEGFAFACNLRASFYKSSKQFFDKLWNMKEMEEIAC